MKKMTYLLTAGLLALSSVTSVPASAAAKRTMADVVSEYNAAKKADQNNFEGTIIFTKYEWHYYTGDELNFKDSILDVRKRAADGTYGESVFSFSFTNSDYSEYFTIDTSEVDMNKAGKYKIYISSVKDKVLTCPSFVAGVGDYNVTLDGYTTSITITVDERPDNLNEKPELTYTGTLGKDYLQVITGNDGFIYIWGNAGDGKEYGFGETPFTFDIEDESVATIDLEHTMGSSIAIKGNKPGETMITATAPDGRSISLKIVVIEYSEETTTTTTRAYINTGENYIPKTTTTIRELNTAPVTTQAPPALGETRIVIKPESNALRIKLGEKFNPDDISLGTYVWGYANENYEFYEDSAINYSFTVGSGKHKNCYTLDTSELDTSKEGHYRIYYQTVPNVKEKFTFDNSNSSRFPKGKTYELITQGGFETVIDVDVIDPAKTTTAPEPYLTTTTITTIPYGCDTLPVTVPMDNPNVPIYPDEIDYIAYYLADPLYLDIGSPVYAKDIILHPVITGHDKNGNEISAGLKELNYEFDANSGKHQRSFMIDATNVDTSKAGLYYIDLTIRPGVVETFVIEDSESKDFPNGTYTALMNSNIAVKIPVVVGGYKPQNTECIENTATTTTTTIAYFDYATKLEYDNSAMQVGESRKIRFYNPETNKSNKLVDMGHSDNISVKYNEGDDFVTITAIKPGKVELYLRESTCTFNGSINDIYISYDSSSTTCISTTTVAYSTYTTAALTTKVNYDEEIGMPLYGDVNGDYNVNMADATLIVQHVGNKDKYKLTEQGAINADIDSKKGITGTDALVLQQYIAKIIKSIPSK